MSARAPDPVQGIVDVVIREVREALVPWFPIQEEAVVSDALSTQEGLYTLEDARRLVAEARLNGAQPRVHPNGFIQLDLGPVDEAWEHKQGHSGSERRLHIWNPPRIELPHQETVNEVHDHVFDMRSTVVRGSLYQKLYRFEVGGMFWGPSSGAVRLEDTHELYSAVYGQKSSSRLAPTGVKGRLVGIATFRVRAGQSYVQPAFTLHDTEAEECVVTVMEKTTIHEGNPVVICPFGQAPDNDFDRTTAAPQEQLWDAIFASVKLRAGGMD